MTTKDGAEQRKVRPGPRTFEHFPEGKQCPVCGTDDDGETVLVALDGTRQGNICRAKPFHLACAVAKQFNEGMGILYRRAASNTKEL